MQSIDDLQLDGARYVRAVFVDENGWRLSSFEYEGDLWRSEWLVGFIEDHPYVPGLYVMLRTASYGRDGRLRAVSTVLEDVSDPDPPAPPQIADGGEEIDVTGARLTAEEEAFVDALVGAIVADLGAYPPNGALVRFVLRWFDWSDPAYMTLHALGAEDEYTREGAWRPLEWSNVDRELERAGRVTEQPEVARTAAALAAIYELVEDIPEEYPTSPAIRAVMRRLPQALSAVPRTDHFAAAASHFEAYGIRASLAESNSSAVIQALTARDELPPRD